ncbi:LysR substrate-binding domain-containing protein [Sphingomonas sp. WKB10]|nr:LysR substrate-binding domain-containing protein [Sphingomonas sp. WKB10]
MPRSNWTSTSTIGSSIWSRAASTRRSGAGRWWIPASCRAGWGHSDLVLCAAPCYLDRKGTPIRPVDLGMHDALRFRFPTSGKLQDWNIAGDVLPPCLRTVLTCNNMEAMRAAAIDGLGIAYMPDFLADEAIRRGVLVTVLDHFLVDPGQFSILWSSGRQMSSRMRAFIDFVSERLFVQNLQ